MTLLAKPGHTLNQSATTNPRHLRARVIRASAQRTEQELLAMPVQLELPPHAAIS